MRTNPLHEETDFPRGIGRPAAGALMTAGYFRLEQLTQVTEADLKKLLGMGPKALSILRQALEMKGLSFAVQKTKGNPASYAVVRVARAIRDLHNSMCRSKTT